MAVAGLVLTSMLTAPATGATLTNRLDFTYRIEPFNAGKDEPYKEQERELTKLFNHSLEQAQAALQLRMEARLKPPAEADKAAKLRAQGEAIANAEVQKWEAFLTQYPKHTRARLLFTELLRDFGKRDAALEQLQKARDLDPTNPAPWVQLGHFYAHTGRLADTIECHSKAIELNGYEPAYYQNLANVIFTYRRDAKNYFQADDQQIFDQVVELYTRAIELDPGNFRIIVDAAETFQGMRPARSVLVIDTWVKALKNTNNPDHWEQIYLNIARAEVQCGRFKDAHRHLDRVQLPALGKMKARVKDNLENKEKEAAERAAAGNSGNSELVTATR